VELGPDDALFPAWCEVLAASQRADRPEEPPRPASDHVALGRQLVAPGGSRDGTHRAAVVDGGVAGALRLLLPMKDNPTVAVVDVAVHPEHRRRGIGGTLLAEGIRLAAAAGRTELITEIDEPGADAPGREFALRHGWTCDLLETRRDLVLPPDEQPCRTSRPRPGGRAPATSSSPGATGHRTHSSTTGPCWSSG
jgi:GNAT superfamily N-acetyltransferase